MTTRIKLKRGSGVPNESDLQEHEVAMDVSTGKIFVGSSSTDAGTDCAVLTEKNPANTDSLSEGSSNLYYTDARADARAQAKIDALIDSAPGTLNTLNELAAALGDDAAFSTTVTNSIATKLPLAGGTLTGALTLSGAPTSANHAATKNYVDGVVTSGTGSLDTDDITEATNLYFTNARADARISAATTDALSEGSSNLYYTNARAQAVSINNVVEDTTPQLGGNLDINSNKLVDGSADVLEVDSGSTKLFHSGNLVMTTNQFDTTFAVDVVSSGFFAIPDGYANRLLRKDAGYQDPALEVGSEGSSVTDAVMDFSLFDGGFGNSDRTATIARIDAYRDANDNNSVFFSVDDDGDQKTTYQMQVDGGDVKNHMHGQLRVRTASNDDVFSAKEGQSIKMNTSGSTTSTFDATHAIASGDSSHTVAKFNIDFLDKAVADVDFGFTAETLGDNVTGTDEGFVGRLDFQWKTDGKHRVKFKANTFEDDVFASREALTFTNQLTNINNMMKMNPITTDTTGNRPASPSAGTLYYNTTTKILQYYTNQWRDLANEKGMMFTGANGVLHFYDGSAWKNVLTGASI